MRQQKAVLVVGQKSWCDAITDFLRYEGFAVHPSSSFETAPHQRDDGTYDAVVMFPPEDTGFSGRRWETGWLGFVKMLDVVRRRNPNAKIIVVSSESMAEQQRLQLERHYSITCIPGDEFNLLTLREVLSEQATASCLAPAHQLEELSRSRPLLYEVDRLRQVQMRLAAAEEQLVEIENAYIIREIGFEERLKLRDPYLRQRRAAIYDLRMIIIEVPQLHGLASVFSDLENGFEDQAKSKLQTEAKAHGLTHGLTNALKANKSTLLAATSLLIEVAERIFSSVRPAG